MKYIEEKNDLFNYEGRAWLAHCISADFGMGKGIVTQFNERYNLKQYMIKNFVRNNWVGNGYCLAVKEFKVFNLVTKEKTSKKPTYKTMRQALIGMKNYAVAHKIHTIAMPLVGCGLDCLEWGKVKEEIFTVFKDTDIKIIVCKL
jgi:O-acetyl-ADP-ribose deacetylase (regulator of RNase III)